MTTETKALSPYVYDPDEEGALGLKPEDIRPPQLRFSGKSGMFKFVGEDESTDSFNGVPLRLLPDSRVKFSENEDSSDIECRSNDAEYPVNLTQAEAIGAGPRCQNCEYAQFTTDDKGKTQAPACTLFKNIALASIPESNDEDPMPFLFAVKSTSIKPLMNALNAIELKRRRLRLPAYAFALEFVPGAEAGEGRRKYYPLNVRVADARIPDDWLPVYAGLWQWIRQTAEHMDMTAPIETAAAEGEPVASPATATASAPPPMPDPEGEEPEPEPDDDDEGPAFDEHGNPIATTAAAPVQPELVATGRARRSA